MFDHLKTLSKIGHEKHEIIFLSCLFMFWVARKRQKEQIISHDFTTLSNYQFPEISNNILPGDDGQLHSSELCIPGFAMQALQII